MARFNRSILALRCRPARLQTLTIKNVVETAVNVLGAALAD